MSHSLEFLKSQEIFLVKEEQKLATKFKNGVSFNQTERHSNPLRIIRQALQKIRFSKDYGVCEECGENIPIERLRAQPMAILCVDCRDAAEKKAEKIKRTMPEARQSSIMGMANV